MTDDLVKRLADIDPILDAEFDTQLNVRRDPYGATRAIEMALYLLRDQADRIEALTAKCEALGQEVNMAKYGQPDFAWSIHLEAMADLEAECAEAKDRIEALTAERDRAIDDARYNAEYVDLVSQFRAERDAAVADNARLREALETCLTTMERADFADGWCCCGLPIKTNMLKHPSPMDCGHTPVDMGEYHASLAIKNARAALLALKGDSHDHSQDDVQ
jgi:multidrug efflux pump subunit AcrA (membrane-fusion protein)